MLLTYFYFSRDSSLNCSQCQIHVVRKKKKVVCVLRGECRIKKRNGKGRSLVVHFCLTGRLIF